MQKTVIIDVVGLAPALISAHNTPHLKRFLDGGSMASITPEIPAVTTTAQTTYLTGVRPNVHGIVGNGWYFRDEAEIKFWRQSNKLVQAPKLWDKVRELDPSFTVSKMFWWYNMYSTANYAVTPRPMYPADGRKLPDIYSVPPDLRPQLQSEAELGPFPLFEFWGPRSSIKSSQWIARASMRVDALHHPNLTLIYLPHLDYGLQKYGPSLDKIGQDLRDVDAVVGELIAFYTAQKAQIVILSEYGIVHVDTPVHLNRLFREHGLIAIREELGLELLDAGASKAFAVADHQVAHIYVNDAASLPLVRRLVENAAGVAQVLDDAGKRAHHLDHARSGDLIALAAPNAWFTYYYWLDDAKAPDFARTVDIHRKPGYDPVELFLDPKIPNPTLKAAAILAKKKLGFRYLMDLTPLDATLVKGSHGVATAPQDGPLMMTQTMALPPTVACDAVYGVLWQHIVGERVSVPR